MDIKKSVKKRILPFLLALALLFGVSFIALAAGGDGSGGGTGNAGIQATMAGTGFQMRLSNPDLSMSNEGGTYVLEGKYDPTQDIVFTFSLNPNGGQRGFGIYPAKDDSPAGFDGVIVYDKSDSDKTPVLSLGGNYSAETMNPNFFFEEIEDSAYPDHLVFKMADSGFSNERTSDLTIKAGSLEGGKAYCLYFPSSIKTFNNGGSKQLGVNIAIEFETSRATVVESWITGDCKATLYDDGKLVVEAIDGGTGTMPNYKTSDPAPWWDSQYVSQIKQVEVKSGVTVIGNGAFKNSPNLTSASLSETVTTMGSSVFNECEKLESVNIPTGVKELKKNTFNHCVSLKDITLPEGLTTIGELTFNTCGLTDITWPSTVTSVNANAFSGIMDLNVYVNSNAADISIHKWVCSTTDQNVVFHVKCDQLEEFKEKNPEIINVTFEATHTESDAVKENEVSPTCTEEGSYDEVVYCSVCNTEVSREKKTIDALGHTPVVLEAVEPTCTEAGKTEGKKCSVCGEVLEAQKDIPALGHDYEVIPEVISTCTSKGSTVGAKCTRCGEYLIEPKEVPMIRHDYQDGKCTVCGAEDPDYKPAPEEPDEPTPVEPVTKFTGLADSADKNGNWWYYTDGKIDKTHTGVDQNKYGWWRVENGKVNFNAQSIYQNENGWWKTTDGKVTFKETGVFQNEYGWWRVEESKVNFNAQSIYQNQYGWWKTTDGKVTFKENGLFKNQYGTWKVENSKVNFNYNGTYQGKTIKNGKVQ